VLSRVNSLSNKSSEMCDALFVIE